MFPMPGQEEVFAQSEAVLQVCVCVCVHTSVQRLTRRKVKHSRKHTLTHGGRELQGMDNVWENQSWRGF